MNIAFYQSIILTLSLSLSLSGTGSANTGNLLLNSGFEDGLYHWVATGNAALKINSPELRAYEGSVYIYGSATPTFTVSQDVELEPQGVSIAEIDKGTLRVHFGGWQAGYYTQKDNGTISIHFIDSNNIEIKSSSLPSFYSNMTWVKQSGVSTIPPQTRFIRFQFLGIRREGSGDDGYLDAAFLRIIREPSLSVKGIGLGALELSYSGFLYESDDLITWRIIADQPVSPYRFFPTQAKQFFQAK